MSEKRNIELKENDLKKVTGGQAGDDISYGSYSVKENGVYTNGTKYVFVINKNLDFGGSIINTLFKYYNGDKFTSGAINHIDSLSLMSNSYEFVCVTTEQAFRDAKKPSDL